MKTEIDRSREQGARFCEQRQDISRFVGRKRELEIVDERLRIVKEGGKLFQSIVNFHGLPGIGKTALLDNLVPLARDRGFSCIHLDQTDINPDCYLTDKPKPVGLNVLTLEARQKLLWATGSSPESRVLRPEKRTVLCLDEIKLTPEMEDAFIVPLAETEDSVVVVAGPTPQKWIDFAARRRVYQRRLPPLSPEESGALLGALGIAKETVGLVGRLTGRHPGANEFVAQMVAEGCIDEGRLAGRLVEKYVLPTLMPGAAKSWRESLNFRGLLTVLSTVPQFDVNTLIRMLKALHPGDFGEKSGRSGTWFFSLTGRLVENGLTEWEPEKRGYVFDPVLSHMLQVERCLTDPEVFITAHRLAREIYAEWAKDNSMRPEDQATSFMECLYHTGRIKIMAGKEKPEAVVAAFCEGAQVFLRTKRAALSPEAFQEMAGELGKVLLADADLKQAVGEAGVAALKAVIDEASVVTASQGHALRS